MRIAWQSLDSARDPDNIHAATEVIDDLYKYGVVTQSSEDFVLHAFEFSVHFISRPWRQSYHLDI